MTGHGCRGRGIFLVAAAVILALIVSVPARADGPPLKCMLTGEDVGNGYQYTVSGIGTFSVNCKDGETVKAAVISTDENCIAKLYKNDRETDFSDGVILDNGSYELRIYQKEKKEDSYGSFRFTVENSYEDILGTGGSSFQAIDNPAMELTVDRGMFTYTLPDGETIRTNVPQGGQADIAVSLEISSQLHIFRILRNGEPLDITKPPAFNRPGTYEIVIQDNAMGLNGSTGYQINYCFTLHGQEPRNISHITAPMGFELRQVLKDGQELPVRERFYAQLESDGNYQVVFAQIKGEALWEMKVQRDTVPPSIHFLEEVPFNGEMKEDVSYLPPKPGNTIVLYRNGQQVEAPGNRIVLNGVYRMTIADTAGNEREYRFTIRRGYRIVTKEWIIIPFILLAAAVGIAFHCRRNMRVL